MTREIAIVDTHLSDAEPPLDPRVAVTAGMVRRAVKHEMARSVEDVLARRTRALFIHVDAAIAVAGRVARSDGRRARPRNETWQAASAVGTVFIMRPRRPFEPRRVGRHGLKTFGIGNRRNLSVD